MLWSLKCDPSVFMTCLLRLLIVAIFDWEFSSKYAKRLAWLMEQEISEVNLKLVAK